MVDHKPNIETLPETQPEYSSSIHKRGRLVITILVFALAFALYLFTLAPTVTLVDSGELILAVQTLGVAHPPGFPLYVLLAHLFSLLPFGNIAVRIHVFSAVFAALASSLMVLAITESLQTLIQANLKSKTKAPLRKKARGSAKELISEPERTTNPVLVFAPAILGGLLFAFARTLWAYATIAE